MTQHVNLPPVTDPRWADFVQGKRPYPLKCLAARIMLGQVKVLAQRDREQAIRMAHDFFERNAVIAAEDLKTLFERNPT